MNRGQKIDEAFCERRATLEEQERRIQARRALEAARQLLLDEIRSKVLEPILDEIADAFARNGCPAERSTKTEAENRVGVDRTFRIPSQASGQPESLIVTAVAVLGDPNADSLRINAQVAERRALSDAFDIHQFQIDKPDREALESSLRDWLYNALEELVTARLARRGM